MTENKTCIVYLASPFNSVLSTGDKRIDMLHVSLKNVTQILQLPIIIFHEDFTEPIIENFKKIYNDITFEQINFDRPDLPFIKHNRPKNYMMMCRFFSGQMQKHISLQKYDSYIRFDDDSFFIEPFISQPEFMKTLYGSQYVFRSMFREGQNMRSLFDFTKDFCKNNNIILSSESINNLKKIGFLNIDGDYSGLSPYNNFHYSELAVWKHPVIEKYIDEIESVNGCLVNNWMDANIHAMIIFVLMPPLNLKVSAFMNFGYRHNRHFSLLNNVNIQYRNNEDFFPKE